MSASNDDENPPRGELSREEREAFRKRASDLGSRLDKVKAETREKAGPEPDERARGAAMGQAMKISIELVVGIAVGGFIGKVLDDQFGTAPWFLIVFLMLGFAAGLANIVRTARRMQAEAEPLQRSAKAVPDDDDD
ncbi:AtpZ/AtpI family protein [uncultured Hyphomicrobium sp.]|uniref:AtpZ/AtpI family protein n=1 Tax=uncultured Hyphomicrobium sp. TaxID=194373 RepID=UPI0025F10764|nr:AtpZ/AtpI family protein [uncultured Hyphomicrobium sp.]